MQAMAEFRPQHFLLDLVGRVAVVRLNRPERKNPLTFESYAELRDMFRALPSAPDVRAVVIASRILARLRIAPRGCGGKWIFSVHSW